MTRSALFRRMSGGKKPLTVPNPDAYHKSWSSFDLVVQSTVQNGLRDRGRPFLPAHHFASARTSISIQGHYKSNEKLRLFVFCIGIKVFYSRFADGCCGHRGGILLEGRGTRWSGDSRCECLNPTRTAGSGAHRDRFAGK